MYRKLICLLLALCLTLSGFTALAEDGTEQEYFEDDWISAPVDDDTLSAGDAETGDTPMLTMGTMVEGAPQADVVSPSLAGEDETLSAGDEEYFPDDSASFPDDEDWDDDEGDEDEVTVRATPKVTASLSSVTVKKGNTTSVTMTVTGVSGRYYLQYSLSNTASYSASWGSWSRGTIPLRITGKAPGTGIITVYLRSSSTKAILASTKINMTVPNDAGRLTLSSTSISVAKGGTQTVNVTLSNYSGSGYLEMSNSNGSAATASWGSWSGYTIPLTVTGKAAGSGKITIYLKTNNGTVVTSAQLSYNVYNASNPKLTLSQSSASMKVGSTASVTLTPSGYSGEYQLTYSHVGQSYFSCQWTAQSGGAYKLTMTGLNEGSGSVTVYMKNKSGTVLAQTTLSPVTVTKQQTTQNPQLVASTSSVSLTPGKSTSVTMTYKNVTGTVYMQCSSTNTSAYTLKWGSWSNSSIPLTITGQSKGSGTVTVYLKRKSDDATLATTQISVKVDDNSATKLTIQDVGYNFSNYSATVPLSVCQLMYGNNIKAKYVYQYNLGNGGVCFGMAGSSALLDVAGSAPYVSGFSGSRAKISNLQKSDSNTSIGLTVNEFVMAMHISQVSNNVSLQGGVDNLVNTVISETNAGRPVLIGMFGYYGGKAGHAVLAFGYEQVNSTTIKLRIYDSNYQSGYASGMKETALTCTKSGSSWTTWSYPLTSSVTWGSGRTYADIKYCTYSNLSSMWNKRGSLGFGYYNMVSTTNQNFTMTDFDGNVVVRYQDGEVAQSGEGFVEASALRENGVDQPIIFYVPTNDIYSVVTDGGEAINMVMMDEELSIDVNTSASELVQLAVVDSEGLANAQLPAEEGIEYSITLGSMASGQYIENQVDGTGNGNIISIGLSGGVLSMSEDANADVDTTTYDNTYDITAQAYPGGSITPDGTTTCLEGANLTYDIKADSNFIIRQVLVDGVSVGAVNEYYFENVSANHSIVALFSQDISSCGMELSRTSYTYDGTEKQPTVTVTDASGQTLTENVDYYLGYDDNTDVGTATVHVLAVQGGAYYGEATLTFEITGQTVCGLDSATVSGNSVSVRFTTTVDATLIAAAYDAQGGMISASQADVTAGDTSASITLSGASDASYVRVYMVNGDMAPLCEGITAN